MNLVAYGRPRRLDRPGSDPAYLAAVRTLRCCAHGMADAGPCAGGMEANHAGPKPGVALKAPDRTAIPMCHRHHGMWTDHLGAFRGWVKAQRRLWADAQILMVQALCDARVPMTAAY